ncbi:hypothetical protein KEM56_003340, partial [Ascosphaera pollenicola]
MSLVRDSIAGRLAAARITRAKASAGIGSAGALTGNAIAGLHNVPQTAAPNRLEAFRPRHTRYRFHTYLPKPQSNLQPDHCSADARGEDDVNASPVPIRYIQPSDNKNGEKQANEGGRKHFIAASKYTGTKKWGRLLQRQRVVQRPKQSRLTKQCKDANPDILWQTQTPSEDLISALQAIGNTVKIYKLRDGRKRDFSWLHPGRLRREKSLFWNSRRGKVGLIPELPNLQVMSKPARISYPTIVAAYLREIEPLLRRTSESESEDGPYGSSDLDRALVRVFNDETLKYLSDRGYSPVDVVNWAWILTGQTPSHAAKRYHALEQHRQDWTQELQSPAKPTSIPPFVLLFILRQENISADALQYLIIHTSNLLFNADRRLKRPDFSATKLPWNPFINTDSTMILVIRLLRAARAVWPSAFLSIAQIFTSVLGYKPLKQHYGTRIQDPGLRRRLIQQYNKILNLIALPCNIHPFHSNAMQQRAQFNLLREMTRFNPPLVVNRMGFQSITRVQIAHARTDTERDWAKSQLKSWPPWKELRLGIDSLKGEGSESRAAR